VPQDLKTRKRRKAISAERVKVIKKQVDKKSYHVSEAETGVSKAEAPKNIMQWKSSKEIEPPQCRGVSFGR
jgi:uncharacterized protein YerC